MTDKDKIAELEATITQKGIDWLEHQEKWIAQVDSISAERNTFKTESENHAKRIVELLEKNAELYQRLTASKSEANSWHNAYETKYKQLELSEHHNAKLVDALKANRNFIGHWCDDCREGNCSTLLFLELKADNLTTEALTPANILDEVMKEKHQWNDAICIHHTDAERKELLAKCPICEVKKEKDLSEERRQMLERLMPVLRTVDLQWAEITELELRSLARKDGGV